MTRDFKEVSDAFDKWYAGMPVLIGDELAVAKAAFAGGFACARIELDKLRKEYDEEVISHDIQEKGLESRMLEMLKCFNLSIASLPDWVDASKVKLEDLPRLVAMMTQHQKMADKLNSALASKLVECRKMLTEQQHKLDELQRVVRIMWNQG